MKKAVLLFALVGIGSGTFAQQLTKDEKRALELKPGVVLVMVHVTATVSFSVFPHPIQIGHYLSGTGFVFRSDGYIITNSHVVQFANLKDPHSVAVWRQSFRKDVEAAMNGIENALNRKMTAEEKLALVRTSKLTLGQPTLKVFLANGKSYDADILDFSPSITEPDGKDVAILKIPADDLPTVELGDSDAVRVKDSVLVIGYPATVSATLREASDRGDESDLVPNVADGQITAIKTASNGTQVFQSDVAITRDISGGPAFDEQGHVIGIVTVGTESTQGFITFFVSINAAKEFLRREGVAPGPGAFTRHWRRALELFEKKRCGSAIAEFDDALQIMPGLPDGATLRASAVKCAENEATREQTAAEATSKADLESTGDDRGVSVSPGSKARPGRDHSGAYVALVIGINDYSSLPKLRTAVNDAEQVAAALHDLYGFDTRLLRNASRHEILKALAEYRRNLDENANFLVYYAGHGINDKKADKAYWLPSDAERDDTSYWIIADEITTAIKVIPARHVLVISDSCYSGGISRDVSAEFGPQKQSRYLEKMMDGGSRTLMASGGLEPVSDEGSGGHSVFANALLKGLTTDSDEAFSAHQLFEQFIFNSVVGRSDQTPQYGAIRNAGQENDGDFVFVRAPH